MNLANQLVQAALDHHKDPRYLREVITGLIEKAQPEQATQLQAQVEALRKEAEWQAIETAPKDGTEILVSFKKVGVKCVAWTTRWGDPTDEYAHWHIDDNKHDPYPLRGYNEGDELGWKPLPQPPALHQPSRTG
jgi:hypothetical protein